MKLQSDIGRFPSICGICPNKNQCDLPNCPSNKRERLRRKIMHFTTCNAQCAWKPAGYVSTWQLARLHCHGHEEKSRSIC